MLLIVQHVGVPAAIAVVDRERIAQEDALQPRIALDLFFRHGLAALVAAEARLGGERRALVAVVLRGPVLPPLGRIRIVFTDLDHAHVRTALLGFALEDIGEQGCNARGPRGHDANQSQVARTTPPECNSFSLSHHRPFRSSSVSGPPSPAFSPWPTPQWQCVHGRSAPLASGAPSIS